MNETYKSTLLERLLATKVSESSADDRADGLSDGFNIPLDAQARALTSKLKLPMAKRLVALLFTAGVPGRYMNQEDVEGTVLAAADMLRTKASTRKAFIDFYDRLATAKGYSIPDDTVAEAKGKGKEQRDFTTYAAWKRAATAAGAWIDGDKDIANAMVGDNPYKRGKTKSIGEWDGDCGYITVQPVKEAVEAKKGDYIQKLFTTVLIELGLPETLAGVSAPAVVQAGLQITATLIEQDGALERSLRTLAQRLGVKSDDVQSKVSEAVDVGQDEYANNVIALVTALGIPDAVLAPKRALITKALRERKMELGNRTIVNTQIQRLLNVLQKNTNTNKE